MNGISEKSRTVHILIPCLVDQILPEIGKAMVRILRYLDLEPLYSQSFTCCGQPAFNAGHMQEARQVAEGAISAFPGNAPIVCPSGSCVAMIRNFYPQLFANQPERIDKLRSRVFEFSEFLIENGLDQKLQGRWPGKVAFHNSCHSANELGVKEGPRKILCNVKNCELVGDSSKSVCCGFGGLFSIKFEKIAEGMGLTRLEDLVSEGVVTVVSNDPGCILQLQRIAQKAELSLQIIHLAEFLAASISHGSSAKSGTLDPVCAI